MSPTYILSTSSTYIQCQTKNQYNPTIFLSALENSIDVGKSDDGMLSVKGDESLMDHVIKEAAGQWWVRTFHQDGTESTGSFLSQFAYCNWNYTSSHWMTGGLTVTRTIDPSINITLSRRLSNSEKSKWATPPGGIGVNVLDTTNLCAIVSSWLNIKGFGDYATYLGMWQSGPPGGQPIPDPHIFNSFPGGQVRNTDNIWSALSGGFRWFSSLNATYYEPLFKHNGLNLFGLHTWNFLELYNPLLTPQPMFQGTLPLEFLRDGGTWIDVSLKLWTQYLVLSVTINFVTALTICLAIFSYYLPIDILLPIFEMLRKSLGHAQDILLYLTFVFAAALLGIQAFRKVNSFSVISRAFVTMFVIFPTGENHNELLYPVLEAHEMNFGREHLPFFSSLCDYGLCALIPIVIYRSEQEDDLHEALGDNFEKFVLAPVNHSEW